MDQETQIPKDHYFYRLPFPRDKLDNVKIAKFIARKIFHIPDELKEDILAIILDSIFEAIFNHGINFALNTRLTDHSVARISKPPSKKNLLFCRTCERKVIPINLHKCIFYYCENCDDFMLGVRVRKSEMPEKFRYPFQVRRKPRNGI